MNPAIKIVTQAPNPRLDNTIQYWGFFTREEIDRATADGSLLMMDLDFGRTCSLNCPTCFRKKYRVDKVKKARNFPDMEYDELMSAVDQACALGLRSIKICGAGEPTEDPMILQFARDLTARGIGLAIFTKGHIIGDDEATARIFGPVIKTGEELARAFMDLKVSFLLNLPSFDSNILNRLVGTPGYAKKALRAAGILARVGFNRDRPTRLAFIHAPITKKSIGGAMEVYDFARKRNILPLMAFSMVSGTQFTPEFIRKIDAPLKEKLKLFKEVYGYNLDHGLNTRDQLFAEGLSSMPGIHPCNQIAVGLYLLINGLVMRCPGDYAEPLGDVRKESLAEIWQRCRHWQFKGQFNCGCPFKEGITLPNEYRQLSYNL